MRPPLPRILQPCGLETCIRFRAAVEVIDACFNCQSLGQEHCELVLRGEIQPNPDEMLVKARARESRAPPY